MMISNMTKKRYNFLIIILIIFVAVGCSVEQVPPQYQYTFDDFDQFESEFAIDHEKNVYLIQDRYQVKNKKSIYYQADLIGKLKSSNNFNVHFDLLLLENGDLYRVDNKNKLAQNVAEFRILSSDILVLTKDGVLYGWGQNSFGSLGSTDIHGVSSSDPFKIVENVKSYFFYSSTGIDGEVLDDVNSPYYGMAVTNDGFFYVWGKMEAVQGISINRKEVTPTIKAENVASFNVNNGEIMLQLNTGETISLHGLEASDHDSSTPMIPSFVKGPWSGVIKDRDTGGYRGFRFNFTEINGTEAKGNLTVVQDQSENPDFFYGVDYRFTATLDDKDTLIIKWSDGSYKFSIQSEDYAVYYGKTGKVALTKD